MDLEFISGEQLGWQKVATTPKGLHVLRIWNKSVDVTNDISEQLGLWHGEHGIFVKADTPEEAASDLLNTIHDRMQNDSLFLSPVTSLNDAILKAEKQFDVIDDDLYLTLALFPTGRDVSCVRIIAKEEKVYCAIIYADKHGLILELKKEHAQRVFREGRVLILELDENGLKVAYEALLYPC